MPAALVAAGVFAGGFLALNAFYWSMGTGLPGPGLYGYLSSSIGDAIALPLLAYFLVRLNSVLPGAIAERVALLVGAAVGAVSGIALQAVWLHDPHPRVNWTLVAPGKFNSAGWYHAAFLVVVSALTLGLLVRAVTALVLGRNNPVAIRGNVIGVILSALLFGGLLLVDNLGSVNESSWATTALTGAALLLGALTVWLVSRPRTRRSSR